MLPHIVGEVRASASDSEQHPFEDTKPVLTAFLYEDVKALQQHMKIGVVRDEAIAQLELANPSSTLKAMPSRFL